MAQKIDLLSLIATDYYIINYAFILISLKFDLRYSCVNLFLFVNKHLNTLYEQTIEYAIGFIIEETYLFCFYVLHNCTCFIYLTNR